tara:strand:- start:175 stop:384 length:210 start_codon:yes stop_codon:yes gene_type:complete
MKTTTYLFKFDPAQYSKVLRWLQNLPPGHVHTFQQDKKQELTFYLKEHFQSGFLPLIEFKNDWTAFRLL